jgi:hypothetical protein
VAGILALAAGVWVGASVVPVLRLILESSVLFAAFIACLMAGAAQRSLYIDLLRTALGLLPRKHKQPVAAY